MTCWFVTMVMSAKYLSGANDLFLNALCIGFILFTVISISGDISGGCFNPAVAFAQMAYQAWVKPTGYKSLNGLWWIYPTATWLGGAFAGLAKHLIKDAHESLKESEEYKYSLVEAMVPEVAKVKDFAANKVSLDKSVEKLDEPEEKSERMGLN